MANPTLLDMPIARDGNKNAIPTTDDGTTGLLSQQYGWQLINAIPPQQGGKAVKREDFNGALYLLSNLLFHLQKGWQFEWNSKQDYYAGCVTKDTTDGKMYRAKNDVPANNTEPHNDTTNWEIWDLSAYLPLSGGTITGNTSFNADLIMRKLIRAYDDTGALHIVGGVGNYSGGELVLYGRQREDSYAGAFALLSMLSGGNEKILYGYPDGTLTWGGNDLGSSAIVAKSLGGVNGYVKRASGEIIQWGDIYTNDSSFQAVDNGYTATITFPISFSAGYSYCAVANMEQSSIVYPDVNIFVYNHSASQIKISYTGSERISRHIRYFAIGV